MEPVRCGPIYKILNDVAKRHQWDSFVFTFSMNEDWTQDKVKFVQECTTSMKDLLVRYKKLGIENNWQRYNLVKTDMPQVFKVHNFTKTKVDHKLEKLTLEYGWINGLSIPLYGFGGALGLTVFLSSLEHNLEARAKNTVLELTPKLFQMNAWARQLLIDSAQKEPLTLREIECIRYVGEGKKSHEISELLFLSKRTVDFHIHNAMEKLGVTSRSQAAWVLAHQSLPELSCYKEHDDSMAGKAVKVV